MIELLETGVVAVLEVVHGETDAIEEHGEFLRAAFGVPVARVVGQDWWILANDTR